MLTDNDVERLFAQWKTPEEGRKLVREIRSNGPVRALQGRMDTVRTRYNSTKMGRPLYAESRTVELPAIVWREHDPRTLEIWPQPCLLDIVLRDAAGTRTSRLQHTPDVFAVEEDRFVLEEWRTEERLLRLAAKRPSDFYKDEAGQWHFAPVEQFLTGTGIEYRLRSADELPRTYIANLRFLEDYSRESTPPVPTAEAKRLIALLAEKKRVPHLDLVHEHRFKADHIFQMVLEERAYVDLSATTLSRTEELVVYSNQVVAQADAVLHATPTVLPPNTYALRVGSRFLYDDKPYEIALLGKSTVLCRSDSGTTTDLPLQLVGELFRKGMLSGIGSQTAIREPNLQELLIKESRLKESIRRLDAMNKPATPDSYSERSLRRFRGRIRGLVQPQDQLVALMPAHVGNQHTRLPAEAFELAKRVLKEHNVPAKPNISATHLRYVVLCDEAGIVPMGKTAFYRWIRRHEDVAARQGRRMAYQLAPIPFHVDDEHPVHGALPHEVAYCDHTVVNTFLKGLRLPDLGKPTLTIITDGAVKKPRALYLSYQPASTVSVLMCLRDYVRRHGRLPRVLVLDNGREFHSDALKLFCSVFNIEIRWRRRSRPRDSSLVERHLGAIEQEVVSSLDGNSIALKDPRMVSSSHLPQKHIKWTLPALHGAFESFCFDVYPGRVHPRLGVTPNDYEKQLILELGAREHLLVRYDSLFKLMTSPHPRQPTRVVDRQRGVYVDGQYYWNDDLATAKRDERVEVRIEMWNARVVYLQFRDKWIVGQARDGGRLEGRFRTEYELQLREEARRSKSAAANDKHALSTARKKVRLWTPEFWDERLREQACEEHHLYARLGMVEALPEARNVEAAKLDPPLPRGSRLDLIRAIEHDPKTKSLPSRDSSEPLSILPAAQELATRSQASDAQGDEGYF